MLLVTYTDLVESDYGDVSTASITIFTPTDYPNRRSSSKQPARQAGRRIVDVVIVVTVTLTFSLRNRLFPIRLVVSIAGDVNQFQGSVTDDEQSNHGIWK